MADFCCSSGGVSLYNLGEHTLIVFHHISQMISASVMSFSHGHGIVCKVHIAVIAEECFQVSLTEEDSEWGDSYFGILKHAA